MYIKDKPLFQEDIQLVLPELMATARNHFTEGFAKNPNYTILDALARALDDFDIDDVNEREVDALLVKLEEIFQSQIDALLAKMNQ